MLLAYFALRNSFTALPWYLCSVLFRPLVVYRDIGLLVISLITIVRV